MTVIVTGIPLVYKNSFVKVAHFRTECVSQAKVKVSPDILYKVSLPLTSLRFFLCDSYSLVNFNLIQNISWFLFSFSTFFCWFSCSLDNFKLKKEFSTRSWLYRILWYSCYDRNSFHLGFYYTKLKFKLIKISSRRFRSISLILTIRIIVKLFHCSESIRAPLLNSNHRFLEVYLRSLLKYMGKNTHQPEAVGHFTSNGDSPIIIM